MAEPYCSNLVLGPSAARGADGRTLPPKPLEAFSRYWQTLEADWREAGAAGPAPRRDLLDLPDMRKFLNSVLLADVLHDHPTQNVSDFRLTVFGTSLAQLFGADYTRRALGEVPATLGETLTELFSDVLKTEGARDFRFEMSEPSYAESVHGLACPMSREGEQIDVILCMMVPVDFRREPPPYL